jgi:hypothetical protein
MSGSPAMRRSLTVDDRGYRSNCMPSERYADEPHAAKPVQPGAVRMNVEKPIARVKSILLSPRTAWPEIGAEPATIPGLYTGYIMILAALPAVFGFIKSSVIGYSLFGLGTDIRKIYTLPAALEALHERLAAA